jgi:uncharacterized oxidoreductase
MLMPTIHAKDLLGFVRSLFEAGSVPTDEAVIVAASLVDANLCGHDSHGVLRIPHYLGAIRDGLFCPGQPLVVIKETPALLVANGQWNLGQVQANRLLEKLVPKARQAGLAAGTLRQCGHVGRLGEYAEAAARQGLALIALANGHGMGRGVAPPGGIAGRIDTNPLCLGAPTAGDPIVLDMGTSIVAAGKVQAALNRGERVPEGWLQDAQGQPTTDPATLFRQPYGTLLPLGGPQAYKGFGIGLLIDMFAGGLSGAPCSRPEARRPLGNAVLFIAIDVASFAGAAHFLREVGDLADAVRNCPRAEGVKEILAPGDLERRQRARRQTEGIALDVGTWIQLTELAKQLQVPIPPTH